MSRTPRIVGDSLAGAGAGAVWNLSDAERTLDANVIYLPAGDGIAWHVGPELDVLIHVLDGSGTLTTDDGDILLETGVIVWLPARSARAFTAGRDGLRYFSVHQRKRTGGMQISR